MTPLPADPRVKLIAAEYCAGHVPRQERIDSNGHAWPCPSCRQRARNGLAAIDRIPRLFNPDAPLPQPLADPDRPGGKARREGADTSRAAQLAVMPRAGTQRRRILELIARLGHGLTDEEIVARTGLVPNTVRPRRVELVEGGWLRDSRERRLTRAGHPAIVWVLTEQATAALAASVA